MKRRYTILLILLLMGLCMGLAGHENRVLLEMRRTGRLTQADPLENAPPLVAFTTMVLGGFRGILADALWVRAGRLQQEGNYFELNQLARWITQLEPRIADVWAYQAWNLSYNISVLFQDPADRWRWVQSGVDLLRDRGLRYNPASAALHYELGWIFQHKIGALFDQAHIYYKEQWAREMGMLFSGPTPDYALLHAVPDTRKDLLALEGMPRLIDTLEARGVDPFSLAITRTEGLPDTAREALTESPLAPLLQAYVRKQAMREEYKLDPAVMEQIDATYGPLDWRLPPAHAIYWAYTGRPYAEGYEAVALDRMIYQSLIDAFRSGALYADEAKGLFLTMPDITLLPKVKQVFEEAIEKHPGQETIAQAYEIFLKEAILTCYSHHQVKRARELFDEMNRRFPPSIPLDFDAFLYDTLTEEITDSSPKTILQLIEGAVYQSEFWARIGDEEQAEGYQALARNLWQNYYSRRSDPMVWERLGIPSLEDIQRLVRDKIDALSIVEKSE
ncbi:MAG: hypothetical protein EOM20_11325 [Spartobacteria bacterium]|nr:hypothetical protein [Spartobacteria bacterium]